MRGRVRATTAALAAVLGLTAGSSPAPGLAATAGGPAPAPAAPSRLLARCAPTGPAYYAFELVGTGRVMGAGMATGEAEVAFAPSPFGPALAPDGSYLLDVTVRLRRLPEPRQGAYVAWATTTEVDRIQRLGRVVDGVAEGTVAWNKFLVVVTLEPADDPAATTWSGPIVLRGMSRSGMMHTMAGHGPFQQENCARYGYQQQQQQ